MRIRTLMLMVIALTGFGCDNGPKLPLLDGGSISFADHSGRWVLVNYWAEWCQPCRQEIPELNALDQEQGIDVSVYGVNFDGIDGDKLKELVAKMEIEFPVLLQDPGSQLGTARPEVLPTTLLIDPEGNIRTLVGPQNRDSLIAAMATPG